jgi:RNA polymerase sigma-70 factor (ECF subfamily)
MEEEASRILADRDTAEGCVQRVFVKLLRSTTPVERISRRYLFRALRNTCVDAVRHHDRDIEVLALLARGIDSTKECPELSESETRERWGWLLAILPGRPREVVLALAEGLSHSEIAERLGISVRTVEGHWERAKNIARRERERERGMSRSLLKLGGGSSARIRRFG